MDSPTAIVNAITSCFTRASISFTRAASTFAFARIAAAASFGTCPASASVSVAASSTSSQRAYLFASLHTRPISSRVYREINSLSFSKRRIPSNHTVFRAYPPRPQQLTSFSQCSGHPLGWPLFDVNYKHPVSTQASIPPFFAHESSNQSSATLITGTRRAHRITLAHQIPPDVACDIFQFICPSQDVVIVSVLPQPHRPCFAELVGRLLLEPLHKSN